MVSLDKERMEMLDAERAFMEAETKKLQARFKKEKEEIHRGSADYCGQAFL